MALLTISKAVSAKIQRSVAMSELKHEAKIEDLKLQLASAKDLRLNEHARKHTEATIDHAKWFNSLQSEQQAQFGKSLALLQAAIAPASTEK